jgi:LacI family transcriptional regulator
MSQQSAPQPAARRVAVLMERQGLYRESVLRGIWRQASILGWRVRGTDPTSDAFAGIPTWRPEGLIASLTTPEVASEVCRFGLPVVDVFDWVDLPAGAYRVGIDDRAVGRLAATFLAGRGLRTFGFVGELSHGFALRRFEAFRDQLAKDGFPCHGYHGAVHMSSWSLADGAKLTEGPLAEFLRGLPAPAGVLAANDDVALQTLDALKVANRKVPDEIALLGVDDDALLCTLANPPISSIACFPERVGVEAGRLLQMLLDGETCPRETLLAPGGVVERRSTDLLAVDDQVVVQAMRWLRDNAERPARIEELLDILAVSRRSLELKFAKHLGRSPYEELTRLRIERAQALLRSSDLPIQMIARRSGFRHPGRLAATFQHSLGQTPTEYRRLFRDMKA